MMPDLDAMPIALSHFSRLEGVVDAIYNPLSTRLILEAKERGIPAAGGLYMLVAQAIRAAECFIGEDFSQRLFPIYQTILKKKQNLVLVGMPGCGKSTLGKILAEQTGKEFFDTDAEVERDFGKKIPEIFSQLGEEGFRSLETDAIRKGSLSGGKVIATGGGAILREENVRLLRQNGVILFLDAPLESLVATSDRPLSSNAADLKRRYEERYDLYCAAAHHKIGVSRNLKENISAIEKVLQ
jgi:shikimate dehydrogenase